MFKLLVILFLEKRKYALICVSSYNVQHGNSMNVQHGNNGKNGNYYSSNTNSNT